MDGAIGAMQQRWTRVAARLRDGLPLPSAPLRALLGQLLDEPRTGAWHPTGFVVLNLADDDVGTLRLHLWPEQGREYGTPCWPVHDHVWWLRSQVLCGTVRSREYTVREESGATATLYAVHYGPEQRSSMHRSERQVVVTAAVPTTVEAGQRYTVDAGVFHASRVEPGCMAATLVATRRTGQPRPWVVGPSDGPPRVPVQRPAASTQLVRGLVERVRDSLCDLG
ncbi:MAG: hypothetical protein K0V04_04385 [Deltaproteobacteria bacterium]|nr:hypothetical protein [Deltaproteobacteria bacterium]